MFNNMENKLDIKSLKDGTIYKFEPKIGRGFYYVGRILEITEESVMTSGYMVNNDKSLTSRGSFDKSVYDYHEVRLGEIEAFLNAERKHKEKYPEEYPKVAYPEEVELVPPVTEGSSLPVFPRAPLIGLTRKFYYIGDLVCLTRLDNSTKNIPAMIAQVGKINIVTHKDSYCVEFNDNYLYSYKDVELVKRGEIGKFKDNEVEKEVKESSLKFKLGDIVYISCDNHSTFKLNDKVKIEKVDLGVTELPYRVENDEGHTKWFDENSLSASSISHNTLPVPTKPKFVPNNRVVLLHSNLESLKPFIGKIGIIENEYHGSFLAVSFIKDDGRYAKAMVTEEDLMLTTEHITNSFDDREAKRHKAKAFTINCKVKVLPNVIGYHYSSGDIGIVEDVYSNCCSVRFFISTDSPTLATGKVHTVTKKYIDVIDGWKPALRVQDSRGLRPSLQIKDEMFGSWANSYASANIQAGYSDGLMGLEMVRNSIANTYTSIGSAKGPEHVKRYIAGYDPYDESQDKPSGSFEVKTKVKVEPKDEIKDRVVKPKYLPSFKDELSVMISKGLIVPLEKIKDRTIAIKRSK